MGVDNKLICANKECLLPFIPLRKNQKFCSVKCRINSFSTTILIRIAPIIKCPNCQCEINLKELRNENRNSTTNR